MTKIFEVFTKTKQFIKAPQISLVPLDFVNTVLEIQYQ